MADDNTLSVASTTLVPAAVSEDAAEVSICATTIISSEEFMSIPSPTAIALPPSSSSTKELPTIQNNTIPINVKNHLILRRIIFHLHGI